VVTLPILVPDRRRPVESRLGSALERDLHHGYLPEKIELFAADFVGVVGRLDQCFDLWKKSTIAGIMYRRKPAIAIGMFIRSGSFSPG
jgi:hypothetical protein